MVRLGSTSLKSELGRKEAQKSQKRRFGFARFEPSCGHFPVFVS
jgi:hypothetical protein